MKKVLVLGLASLFLLTGCGNKVTCTRKLSEGGKTITAKIIAKVKSNKIDSFDVQYDTDSKDTAKLFCTVYKSAKCSGKTVKITGDDALSMVGISKSELKKTTKKDFIKGIESTGFKCN